MRIAPSSLADSATKRGAARFNLHRDSTWRSLIETLGDPKGRWPVFFLGGEHGSGRRFLIDAAAREMGAGWHVQRMTLKGFEPDLVDRCDSAEKWSAWCCALSEIDGGEVVSTSVSGETNCGVARERFVAMLAGAARRQPLVLHVTEPVAVPDPVLAELITTAERLPNLKLALSCSRRDLAGRALPVPRAVEVRVDDLYQHELRVAVGRALGDDHLPDEIIECLWNASQGHPAVAAAHLEHSIAAGRLICSADGRYRAWQPKGESELFEVPTIEAGARSAMLQDFLVLAELCGDEVPALLLARYLKLRDESLREFLAYLDRSARAPGAVLSRSAHSSNDEDPRYSFSTPVARSVIALLASPERRDEMGRELLLWLSQELDGEPSRRARRLLVQLAGRLFHHDLWHRYRLQLAWWVGPTESEELSQVLRTALEEGRASSAELRAVVQETGSIWPVYRRLALLDAWRRSSADDRLAHAAALQHAAVVLYDGGFHDESSNVVNGALRALQEAGPAGGEIGASCFELRALLARRRGDVGAAKRDLERASELGIGMAPPRRALIMLRLADLCYREGDLEAIETHVASGLEALGQEDHPARLELLKYRGSSRMAGGGLEAALRDFESVAELEAGAEVAGELRWATLVTLGDLLLRLERAAAARQRYEEALDAVADRPWTPEVSRVHEQLISLLVELEEPRAAARWLGKAERALDQASTTEVSPHLKRLADFAMRLGELTISRRCLERALALDEKDPEADQPALIVPMKVLADVLWELGDTRGAVHHLHRALAIEERCLPDDDPRLLTSRAYLGDRVEQSGTDGRSARQSR